MATRICSRREPPALLAHHHVTLFRRAYHSWRVLHATHRGETATAKSIEDIEDKIMILEELARPRAAGASKILVSSPPLRVYGVYGESSRCKGLVYLPCLLI